ncbi:MAG: pyridoxal-dependent decarboxylase, partial [Solirubrobacteraceae bacterium]
AGTTNTGAIDPLADLAELCRARGAWLHVDAAYGGFATLTERGRELLRGIGAADSVTLDPHKWLYQPYECGALLVRDDHALRTAFQITPDYLQDSFAGDEVNLADRGVQLTRNARALKVWVSLQYFGLEAFTAAIDRSLDLARLVCERVQASDALELMAPPSLGVACFRRRFPGADRGEEDGHNAGLVVALERSGLGLVSSTMLRGRYALRVCVLNHTTTSADIERLMDFLERAEPTTVGAASAAGATGGYQRDHQIRTAPLRRRSAGSGECGVAVDELAGVALFAQLAASDLERIAALARVEARGPRESIVEQWEASLDFYVIVAGRVEVLVDEAVIAELAGGDFFGELGALDWGAGDGYPRVASVRTLEATKLLTFPTGSMNELARDHPPIAREIRRVAAQRQRINQGAR